MATGNNAKVFSLLRLAIPEHGGYENYVLALRDAGMVENTLDSTAQLQVYGDGTISGIKLWHNYSTKTGVACMIDRYYIRYRVLIEAIEFYQYSGEPDRHDRVSIDEDFDFTLYIEELVDAGILVWKEN